MTKLWDQAVRVLHGVLGDAKDGGPELVSTIAEQGGGVHYYCGGPDRRCDHATCRAVSALTEADHLTWDTGAQRREIEHRRARDAAELLVEQHARVDAFSASDPSVVAFTGHVVGLYDFPTLAVDVVGEARPRFWGAHLVRPAADTGLSPATAQDPGRVRRHRTVDEVARVIQRGAAP